MKAARILLVTVLAVVAFGTAPAAAQQSSQCEGSSNYPPEECGVQANQTTVPAGGQLTLTGECPAGAASVTFRLQPGDADLGSATPDAGGAYRKVVTIPSSVQPGRYEIIATCTAVRGVVVTRSVAITVAAPAAAARGTLPRTGASVLPIGVGGIALIGLGAAAVMATRRKRTAV